METKGSAEFLNSSSVGTPNTQSAIRTIGSNEETTDDSHSESIELIGTKGVMAVDTSIPLATTVDSDIVNGVSADVVKPSSNEDSVNRGNIDVVVTSSNEDTVNGVSADVVKPSSNEDTVNGVSADVVKPSSNEDSVNRGNIDVVVTSSNEDSVNGVSADVVKPSSNEDSVNRGNIDVVVTSSNEDTVNGVNIDAMKPSSNEDIVNGVSADVVKPSSNEDIVNGVSADVVKPSSNEDSVNRGNIDVVVTSSNEDSVNGVSADVVKPSSNEDSVNRGNTDVVVTSSNEDTVNGVNIDAMKPSSNEDIVNGVSADVVKPSSNEDIVNGVSADVVKPSSNEDSVNRGNIDVVVTSSNEDTVNGVNIDAMKPSSNEDIVNGVSADVVKPSSNEDIVNGVSADVVKPSSDEDSVNRGNIDAVVTSSNEDIVNRGNIDVIKTSSDVEVDFDDVFGSDPAWIDVPEEYLNISATPCFETKDSSCSDLSFDIEAILNSIKYKTAVVENSSDQFTSVTENMVTAIPPVSSQEERSVENDLSIESAEQSNIQNSTSCIPDKMDEFDVHVCIHESKSLNDSLDNEGKYNDTFNKGNHDTFNKGTAHHDTLNKEGTTHYDTLSDFSVISEPSIDSSGLANSIVNSFPDNGPPITTEHDTSDNSSVSKTCNKPHPSTVSSVTDSSKDCKLSKVGKTKEIVRDPSVKGNLKRPNRCLKKPGQLLLPSKVTCSTKPQNIKSQTVPTIKPTSTAITTKKTIPLPSSKPSKNAKTTTTSQANCKLKQPSFEKKPPILPSLPSSKRLVSAGSDKPVRPRPIKASIPVRDTRKPIKSNDSHSISQTKNMLRKPIKVTSTTEKSSLCSKTVTKVTSATEKGSLGTKTVTKVTSATEKGSLGTKTVTKVTSATEKGSLGTKTVTKVTSATEKGNVGTKTVTKSHIPQKTESTMVSSPRRRTIATSTPSKSIQDVVRALESTPISSKKDGTFMIEDSVTVAATAHIISERKKRRSLIPTPSKKKKPVSSSCSLKSEYDPDFELQLMKQQQTKLCSKVVHSPIDKENLPVTPLSKWSPINRKKKPVVIAGDEIFQCTKYTQVRQLNYGQTN